MKNITKAFASLLTITLLTISLLTINLSVVYADSPPPPPPPGHNSTENVPGGGAPIAGGIGILLALGAAYGGMKVFDFYNTGRHSGQRKPAN
jgi:hypothetical protein